MTELAPSLSATEDVVVKVTVSNGQARITIPKQFAEIRGFLKESGEPGRYKYALVHLRTKHIEILPINFSESK